MLDFELVSGIKKEKLDNHFLEMTLFQNVGWCLDS